MQRRHTRRHENSHAAPFDAATFHAAPYDSAASNAAASNSAVSDSAASDSTGGRDWRCFWSSPGSASVCTRTLANCVCTLSRGHSTRLQTGNAATPRSAACATSASTPGDPRALDTGGCASRITTTPGPGPRRVAAAVAANAANAAAVDGRGASVPIRSGCVRACLGASGYDS